MEEIILNAEVRQDSGRAKAKDLREAGYIPAVLYAGGKKPQSVKVSHSEFYKLMHQHRIEGIIISLVIKDDKHKARPCLIKEMQYDPVHGEIIHIDFNEISLTKEIKVNVPVVTKGESVGVKQEGGSLEHILWEIEVECLPTAIPKSIEIDITNLKLKDAIHVKDLALPAGVKVLNDPSSIVLSIAEPMKEEVVEAPVEGEEKMEPEVIKEKKEVPAEGAEAESKEKK